MNLLSGAGKLLKQQQLAPPPPTSSRHGRSRLYLPISPGQVPSDWNEKKSNKVQNLQMLNYINSVLDVFEIEFECEFTSLPRPSTHRTGPGPVKRERNGEMLCEFNCRPTVGSPPSDGTCIPILLICCRLFAGPLVCQLYGLANNQRPTNCHFLE